MLARATAAGVTHVLTIGTDPEDNLLCLAVCRGRANVRCAVGVHPSYISEVRDGDLENLRTIQADPGVIALGEIGLDYFRGKDQRTQQIEVLEFQLRLATETRRSLW